MAICRLIVDFYWTGKTELAKQVARYLHKDNKKVNATCSVCRIYVMEEHYCSIGV